MQSPKDTVDVPTTARQLHPSGLVCKMRINLLLIGSAILVFVGVTLVWMSTTTPLYRASMTVVSVSALSAGSSTPSLGNLGSFAGLSLKEIDPLYEQYLTLLASPDLVPRLDSALHIKKRFFKDLIDPNTGAWVAPDGLRSQVSRMLGNLIGMPTWAPPGDTEVMEIIKKNLNVIPDERGMFTQLQYNDPDPGFALELLTTLERETNRLLRERSQRRTAERIQYLTELSATTTNIELRTWLTRNLSEEYTNMMRFSTDIPVASEVFFEPRVSPIPYHPRPLLYLVISAAFGLIFGLLMVIIRVVYIVPLPSTERMERVFTADQHASQGVKVGEHG